MEDSRRTYSVLVVAAAAKFHVSLREMLPEDRYDPVCAAGSVSEARRALLERPFDIVVISTPLPDEFGTKLALHIIDKSSAGVLLLVKAEHYPDLVNRAKWALIDKHGMTEQEAHRYIEKQAMDRCVTRRTVAEEILAE